jgi:hypothetical protein
MKQTNKQFIFIAYKLYLVFISIQKANAEREKKVGLRIFVILEMKGWRRWRKEQKYPVFLGSCPIQTNKQTDKQTNKQASSYSMFILLGIYNFGKS